uniref:CSON006986 protein n=1 Tax=Culicoides sonorensis TaxID=179676 RepID=A0A336MWB7_CULSO
MSYNAETRVWSGPNDPYLYGNQGIGEAIFEFMNDNPDHMMEIRDNEDEVFLCEKMNSMAIRIAENLSVKGLKPGQNIALVLKNHSIDSPILIACAFVGAVICVIPHDLTVEKYRRILNEIKPKMVIITEKSLAKQLLSASIVANVPSQFYIQDNSLSTCFELRDLTEFQVQGTEEFKIYKCANPENEVAMILISNHNGNSFNGNGNGLKIVNVTHKMIMRGIKQDDLFSNTIMSASNFSHPLEVVRALTAYMTPITRIISNSNEFSAAIFLHSIRKNDVTNLFLDLTEQNSLHFIEYLQKTEFVVRGLEKVTFFGNEFNEKVSKLNFPNAKISFEFIMEELGGSVFIQKIQNNRSESMGKLTSHIKAKIISENGYSYDPDEVGIGELLIGSNFMLPGYLNFPLKNAKKFTEDRFFRTGLYGYFDNAGEFYLIETKKSPIKGRYSK